MANTRLALPAQAKKGEVIEIRTMIQHPMETGHRPDSVGRAVPRDIIRSFVCTYNGVEVFRAELFPAIAANPLLKFFTVATESGELVFAWTDDHDVTHTETAAITVT